MSRPSLTSLVPAFLAAGLCLSIGLTARGQQQPAYPQGPWGVPYSQAFPQPTPQTQAVAAPTAPPASYQPPPVNVGQYSPGYAPYYGAPYYNPTGGGLQGAADAISAQGQFEQQFQQARLTAQDVERSKIDTHRKQLEEWMWERNNMPTLEDNRRRDQYEQLRQSMNNPPSIEIWNGTALNNILVAIQQAQPPGAPGPMVPLNPTFVTQLSLTTGVTSTGVGLLKNGPKLDWPLPLQGSEFDRPRQDIDRQMKLAYDQATTGDVDGKVILQLRKDLDTITATLRAEIETMTPTDNIHGMRYVRELRDTLQALQQPDTKALFAACRSTPANTVNQLVNNMTTKGQTFAPAVAGSEPAYNAVYSGMVAYYTMLTQPTIRTQQTMGR